MRKFVNERRLSIGTAAALGYKIEHLLVEERAVVVFSKI